MRLARRATRRTPVVGRARVAQTRPANRETLSHGQVEGPAVAVAATAGPSPPIPQPVRRARAVRRA